MKLTIQSKQNAQTIVDLFNAIVQGEQMLELIIEREVGDKLCPAFEGNPNDEKLP